MKKIKVYLSLVFITFSISNSAIADDIICKSTVKKYGPPESEKIAVLCAQEIIKENTTDALVNFIYSHANKDTNRTHTRLTIGNCKDLKGGQVEGNQTIISYFVRERANMNKISSGEIIKCEEHQSTGGLTFSCYFTNGPQGCFFRKGVLGVETNNFLFGIGQADGRLKTIYPSNPYLN